MEIREQIQKCKNESEEDDNAYSLFLYGVRSPVTRDYYMRRLRIFFNYIKLLPDETMENTCNSLHLPLVLTPHLHLHLRACKQANSLFEKEKSSVYFTNTCDQSYFPFSHQPYL